MDVKVKRKRENELMTWALLGSMEIRYYLVMVADFFKISCIKWEKEASGYEWEEDMGWHMIVETAICLIFI